MKTEYIAIMIFGVGTLSALVGAVANNISQAFGLNRRISKMETDINELKKCKNTYLTKVDHDSICKASKELTGEKLGRMEDKLDMILDRINHCQHQQME